MSEFRKDPVNKRWVIYSPERAYRPTDFKSEEKQEHEKGYCPFCSGNEKKSGDEILAYAKKPDREPNTPGWWVRVLENKYPALHLGDNLKKKGIGIYDKMDGLGRHEIIIETEEHVKCISDLSQVQVEKVILAYRDRYVEIASDKNIKHILIFKNYGEDAGASLEHAHSQLIATPVVPSRVETEILGANDYYKFRDRCVYCDILDQELIDRERIIDENDEFLAFNFFAGKVPYETWIVPKHHNAYFSTISKGQIKDLAKIIRRVIKRIKLHLGDVNYNMVLHTAPVNTSNRIDDIFHWHLELMPKLTKIAGFEWGTGYYINPVFPEDAAKMLREIELDDEEDVLK